MSYPEFKTLKPTTITFLGAYSKPINLEIAFENLEIVENPTTSLMNTVPRNKKIHFPFVEEEGFISLRLKDKVRTEEEGHQFNDRSSWRSRGYPGNIPFSTSLAFDASIPNGEANKNVAGKIFSSGKILFNGFLSREVAEDFAQDLIDQLIDCGACDEDNELAWFDSQTNNYTYYIGYKVDLLELGKILHEAGHIKGYDNLSIGKKIEIVIPSNADKSHLKSSKEAVQRIKIHESGKILHNGPNLEELEKGYNMITRFLKAFIDQIKLETDAPCLSTVNDRILDVVGNSKMTSREITKGVSVFKQDKINTGIHQLLSLGKLKLVGSDCYEQNIL